MKFFLIKNTLAKVFAGITIIMICINFVSCADLDPDATEFNVPPEEYKSEEELEFGVVGVYATLRDAAELTTFYAPAWAGDDMTTFRASNKAAFREFDQRDVKATNDRLTRNWNSVTNVVNNANVALLRSESLNDVEGLDRERVDRLKGELYFLRAFAFHHLARIHGKIPIWTTPIGGADIKRSSVDEVYKQIESDLLKAEAVLPEIYPGVEAGAPRPNKGSARAMLARIYMDWAGFPVKDSSKYAKAAEKAKEVIDNKEQHGFDLLPDVADLWKVANRFNEESVYTIVHEVSKGRPNRKFDILGLPGELGGWDETFAEIRFFEDFPEGPRKEATYRTDIDWKNLNNQQNPVFAKVTGPIGDLPPKQFRTDRNDFTIRYAEVLLTYAEASGRSGNVTAEAWEALNKVRRRSEGLPIDTPDASVDLMSGSIEELAFTERKWEFAGEYLRWYDLIRMEKMEEALSEANRAPRVSMGSDGVLLKETNAILGSLGTDNYFSPVPADIVAETPSLKD